MLTAISEELLLDRVLKSGIITQQDIAAASLHAGVVLTPPRWGPTIDALIQHGNLSEDTVRRLAAQLSSEKSATERALPAAVPRPAPMSALVETLPPPSPPCPLGETPNLEGSATPAQPKPLGLARTMDSASEAQAQPVTVSIAAFPVPNWDKYEFLGLLGRGGMGAVYKARDRRLGRVVALKFIHGDDPGQIQRFLQEARAQARLAHPHICQVYEVGTVDNKPYIAMQLVDGLPLDQASRTMTVLEKVQVMKDAVEAMHAAHEQGVIHRGRLMSLFSVGEPGI